MVLGLALGRGLEGGRVATRFFGLMSLVFVLYRYVYTYYIQTMITMWHCESRCVDPMLHRELVAVIAFIEYTHPALSEEKYKRKLANLHTDPLMCIDKPVRNTELIENHTDTMNIYIQTLSCV